jgi:glutaconate CoA-transferase subunit B
VERTVATNYTLRELMIVAAAREIRDGEVVFTGMRLPLLAFCVAKNLHAPRAVGLFEIGLVRDTPPPELLYTMSDPPNVLQAEWCTGMLNVMALLQRGYADMSFIGAAEVDRFGNVNTSYVGDVQRPKVRLPGSGGAADLAALAHRCTIIVDHDRRRLPARVGFITSPGYGDGEGWRERVGLPRGGPAAVVTNMAVLGFERGTGEAFLRSYHPGTTVEAVRANTGWDLRVADDVVETPPPTAEEVAVIRAYDPQGHWRV